MKQGFEIQRSLDHLLFKGIGGPFPNHSTIGWLHRKVDLTEVRGSVKWIVRRNRLNNSRVGPEICAKPIRRILVILRNEKERLAQPVKQILHLIRMLNHKLCLDD